MLIWRMAAEWEPKPASHCYQTGSPPGPESSVASFSSGAKVALWVVPAPLLVTSPSSVRQVPQSLAEVFRYKQIEEQSKYW